MILFSVIIPHYNSISSLERLIQSIPQDETIQVIVVDDKSTVNTREIEQKIVSRGGLFLHNTTARKNAGTCRNIGLQQASGRWLIFADADDYFLDNAFNTMKKYADSDADLIYFTPISKYIESERMSDRHKEYAKMIDKYIRCPETNNEMSLRCRFTPPWSKMIRNHFVQKSQILFDEVPASNDVMFSIRTGLGANMIEATSEQIYCIIQSDNSLTTIINEENYWSRVETFKHRQQFIQNHLDLTKYPQLEPTGLRILRIAFKQGYSFKFIYKIYCYFIKEHVTIFPIRKTLYCLKQYRFSKI